LSASEAFSVTAARIAPEIAGHKGYEACDGLGVPNSDSKQTHVITVKPQASRPVQDEWGVYDPEQAGLEAVIRRLTASRDEHNESVGTSLAPHTTRRRSGDVSR
jgi:hypothetical protein